METREEFFMRSLRETLDSVVSVSVRDTLLVEALALAGLPAIPTEADSYRQFVRRALRHTLERALGPELGNAVALELERLIGGAVKARDTERPAESRRLGAWPAPERKEAASAPPEPRPTRSDVPRAKQRIHTLPAGAAPSDSPPSEVSPRSGPLSDPRWRELIDHSPSSSLREATAFVDNRSPTSGDFPSGTADALGMVQGSAPPTDTTSSSRRLPLVFVATRDPELVRNFSLWLDPRAAVVRVTRLVDVLLDLEDAGDRRAVLVLDCQRPPMRAEALAGIAEELPDNVRVVLWGANREYLARLCQISPLAARWIACPRGAPLSEVAERCAQFVG